MKSKIIIALILFTIFTNCQDKYKETNKADNAENNFKKSNYFDDTRIKTNKFNVMFKGDWKSYSELELYYKYNKLKSEELLPYSLIIVEKHKQYKFCSNVFLNFLEFYCEKPFNYDGTDESIIFYLQNMKSLDDEQINYALYFLKLGLINDDKVSIFYLEKIYRNGIGVKKDIKKADELKKKIESL